MSSMLLSEIEENLIETLKSIREKGISHDLLAFAYARVSTTKQAERGNSREDQEYDAREYSERAGLHIVHLFSAAESAFSEGRVNFNLMIDLAIKHKIPNIIFKNTDRLSRNDIDLPRCKKLAREGKIQIHLYEMNMVFNEQSTAEEEMFLDNTNVMAKYWSRKISQGVKRGYKSKAHKRRIPHKAPMGYRWNEKERNWEIDNDTVEIVREIFDLYDNEHKTLQEISEILNAKGVTTQYGKPFYKQVISSILKNRVYAGWFKFHDEEIKGNHPAIITEERFNARMQVMSQKFRGHRSGSTHYLLAKFVKCSRCGKLYTGYKKGHGFVYYNHHCDANDGRYMYFKESDIIDMLNQRIQGLVYSESYTQLLHSKFKNMIRHRDTHITRDRETIEKRFTELEKKRELLLDLYLQQKIDIQRYESKEAEIINQIAVLHDRQKELSEDLSDHYHEVAELIDYLRNFTNLFMKIPPEGKIEFLHEMAYGLETDGESLKIIWKPLYSHLLNAKVAGVITPATYVVSPKMHARQDSNL